MEETLSVEKYGVGKMFEHEDQRSHPSIRVESHAITLVPLAIELWGQKRGSLGHAGSRFSKRLVSGEESQQC